MESTSQSNMSWRGIVPVFDTGRSRLELCLRTMLLLLVIVSPSLWYIKIPCTILCIYGLVFNPWLEKPWFWFSLFTLLFFECYYLWYSQDNHKYLISYCCLATGLAFTTKVPVDFLKTNARLLIGLCFLLAVVAKVISPSYMDGTFFRETLIGDGRFEPMTKLVLQKDDSEFRDHREALASMLDKQGPKLQKIEVSHSQNLVFFSWLMTIWTLIIESLIALAFLVPPGSFMSKLRNYSLCTFIVSTYAVANVIGFGWILSVLAIAQLHDSEKRFASVYFLLIVILHLYRFPWSLLIA